MEEYSDIEIDTFDTCNVSRAPYAIPTTMRALGHHQVQQVDHSGMEIEKNQAGNLGVLRPTSGIRAWFKFKAKQEFRVITQTGKSAKAVMKQVASEEF